MIAIIIGTTTKQQQKLQWPSCIKFYSKLFATLCHIATHGEPAPPRSSGPCGAGEDQCWAVLLRGHLGQEGTLIIYISLFGQSPCVFFSKHVLYTMNYFAGDVYPASWRCCNCRPGYRVRDISPIWPALLHHARHHSRGGQQSGMHWGSDQLLVSQQAPLVWSCAGGH